MDAYGWKIKTWKFNNQNCEQKKLEMLEWKKKWEHKYQMREIFVNNAWALEYRLLIR